MGQHSALAAAKGIGLGIVAILLLLLLLGGVLLFHIGVQGPDLHGAPISVFSDVSWANGDLILTQHRAYGLHTYPIVHRAPVHVGLVWVHPTLGPCIVDTHVAHRPHEQLPDARSKTRPRAGTRIIRMADFLQEYEGLVFRRPVVRGALDTAAFVAAIEQWAVFQPFDPWVSKGQPAFLLGITASSISRPFAHAVASLAGPCHDAQGKRLRGIYCTELTAKLLQRAGALDPAYPAYLCSPLAFTSRIAQIDRAADPYGVAWGPEERIVYKSV